MTLRAPSRFASIDESMLASSAFVTATNTSVLSMFSSSSSSSSAESPCSTIARDVAAARDDDLARRLVELAHLAQHGARVLARGEEEHLVTFLDDGVAVG